MEEKKLFWLRVTGISSLLILACMLAITISLLSFQPRIRSLLINLDEITMELNETSREVTKTMRSLNEQGLSEVYETLDNIQKIDIDRLNESIDSLYRIITPLSRLFRQDG